MRVSLIKDLRIGRCNYYIMKFQCTRCGPSLEGLFLLQKNIKDTVGKCLHKMKNFFLQSSGRRWPYVKVREAKRWPRLEVGQWKTYTRQVRILMWILSIKQIPSVQLPTSSRFNGVIGTPKILGKSLRKKVLTTCTSPTWLFVSWFEVLIFSKRTKEPGF